MLSFSPAYAKSKEADQSSKKLVDNFDELAWSKCIHHIHRISSNISYCTYEHLKAGANQNWVHGPNKYFFENMKMLFEGGFDYDLVMKFDLVPVKKYCIG